MHQLKCLYPCSLTNSVTNITMSDVWIRIWGADSAKLSTTLALAASISALGFIGAVPYFQHRIRSGIILAYLECNLTITNGNKSLLESLPVTWVNRSENCHHRKDNGSREQFCPQWHISFIKHLETMDESRLEDKDCCSKNIGLPGVTASNPVVVNATITKGIYWEMQIFVKNNLL